MTKQTRLWTLSLTACVAAGGAFVSLAGPLDPPIGPITSTYKTLTEVEPRTPIRWVSGSATAVHAITASGSYYLDANIAGAGGKNGIEILADNVTLDLRGFSVLGVGGSLDGIVIGVGRHGAYVYDGRVQSFGGDGIDGNQARGCKILRMHFEGNVGNGVRMNTGSIIADCTAYGNGQSGLDLSNGVLVRGCVLLGNGAAGIQAAATDVTITGCVSEQNGASGIYTGDNGSVSNCSMQLNGADGIRVGAGSTVTGCTVTTSGGDGINAMASCTITGCTSTNNTGDGIGAIDGSTISNCTVQNNGRVAATAASGINATNGCTVTGCTVTLNGKDGIVVVNDAHVFGNFSSSNGSTGVFAGIHVTGMGSTVENNTVTNNDRGIEVLAATGNVVVRNTARSNAVVNYAVPAANMFGTVLAGAAALNANSNPNANIQY